MGDAFHQATQTTSPTTGGSPLLWTGWAPAHQPRSMGRLLAFSRNRSGEFANNAFQHYHALQDIEDTRMTTLTVTARGQVTFRKEVLQHLGIKPGEKIELDLLPDGRAELKAIQRKGSLHNLAGFLKGKTNGKVLTIEEIDTAIADANATAGAGKP